MCVCVSVPARWCRVQTCASRVSLLHNNNNNNNNNIQLTIRHHPFATRSGPSGMVRCRTGCTRPGFVLYLWIRAEASNGCTGGRPREGIGTDRRRFLYSTSEECCSRATASALSSLNFHTANYILNLILFKVSKFQTAKSQSKFFCHKILSFA